MFVFILGAMNILDTLKHCFINTIYYVVLGKGRLFI